MTSKNFTIRAATRSDAGTILQFVRDLADYEKLTVFTDEEQLAKTLFDGSSRAFCLLAEVEGKAAGFAVCFYNYSTFQGKYGIYLEDMFIDPSYRGAGIGKAFFKALAQRAVAEDCGRIQWSVLDWNEPSIEFYKSMKAAPLDGWMLMRLEGQAITDLANSNNETKAA
jgi:GNAT superfamily N-acetyltransferase